MAGNHPFDDLVSIANPPQGYMQNCNVSPFAMMKDSPLVPEKWAEHPYLYNDGRRPAHQRAAMMVDLLDAAKNVTPEQMIGIAFNPQVWHAELWQGFVAKPAPRDDFGKLLTGMDRRRAASDSRAALAYYLFKTALGQAGRALDPPASLTDDADVRAALDKAEQRLNGRVRAGRGLRDLFRVGRQGTGRTWPVSGGTLSGGRDGDAPRDLLRPGRQGDGRTIGQTSTQIVILTRPPQSYMVIPMGESDHPDRGTTTIRRRSCSARVGEADLLCRQAGSNVTAKKRVDVLAKRRAGNAFLFGSIRGPHPRNRRSTHPP